MANHLAIRNPRPRKLPGPQLLHHLVPSEHCEGAAAIEHAALDGTTTLLTYPELHRRADSLAARIVKAHQRFENDKTPFIIPILIPQCPELYISQLATLKAGGAFCPIVLDAPEDRLRFILRDINARVLLTTPSFQPQLPRLDDIDVVTVDADDSCFSEDTPSAFPSPSPRDPAYIMYTSGSTGQPKGVVLSHSAATQALLAHDFHIPAFSRFLQFASPTFDVSVFEIFFPWFRRATLVSCDRRRLLNDLPVAINDLKIDACELTPSVASSLLRGRESVPNLKLLLTIGEMLKPAVVQSFGGDTAEPAILHGMYGPTEATIHCTLQTFCAKDMSYRNIGIPLETVSTFIVQPVESQGNDNEPLRILCVDEEGELAVGGHQLADGYLNRDEQTKAAFVTHPEFGTLYRTGDRAKMLPDGTMECLGRLSNGQVKLRGQRIELGEIEYAASKTPGCRDVVAEVISGILVVFAVPDSDTMTANAVFDTCRAWLPTFMVPGDVLILDHLPYLASGKCDRKALRLEYESREQESSSLENVHNPRLQEICEVLGRVLEIQVSSETILASIGLDSLSAIRIASELRKIGYRSLDAAAILVARTAKQIMANVDLKNHSASAAEATDYSNSVQLKDEIMHAVPKHIIEEVQDVFPCTPVQVAMLVETEKDPKMYCNWIEFRMPRIGDLDSIEKAINELSNIHPMLRSGFVSLTKSQWSYANITWKSLSSEQIIRPASFDSAFEMVGLEAMLRPCIFAIMADEAGARLLLKIHHALYDQWSMDIFQSDLSRLLAGEQCAESQSFSAVANHHLDSASRDVPPETIEFWQKHLQGSTPTSLPLLRGQHIAPSLKSTPWQDTSIKSQTLHDRVKGIGCSAPAVFQTAVAHVLAIYSGVTDIVIGTVFSGRTLPISGIEGAFGPCLATLPLRVDLKAANTSEELLCAVSDHNRALQSHLLVPPTLIRELAGVSPGVQLFDTLFIWQQSTVDIADSGETIEVVDSQDQQEFDLVLEFSPSQANLKVRATYQRNVIGAEQIDILLRQIDIIASTLLSGGLSQDATRALPADLLSISNAYPVKYAETCSILSSIANRAVNEPAAPAIMFATTLDHETNDIRTMSYAELDELSNRTAHMLIDMGVEPNDLVCVCMDKSVNLYVALVAIFKVGAGYLPLLPDTPSTRLNSALAQGNINCAVCDSLTSSKLRQSHPNLAILDVSRQDLTSQSAKAPNVPQIGSRVSYCVFTSGSTGEPKGVPITMDNLQGNLAVLQELYKAVPGDRLLQACSQAFDVSVFEIFFTFYTGMCLCTAPKEAMFQDFEHSIRFFTATHLSLTPTVAALIKPENVPSVRFLITAGEAVTESVHRTWAGRGLHQGYGPSETTNICSVRMNVATDDVLGNIGPPFPNTSAFVASPQGEFHVLPRGAYGEFVFGGEQVFNGYLGREDLNSSKLIQHPIYGKLYRSGDMGRILYDGTLLISGRLDDQVKIRGNRVELGEINAIITEHPSVSDCATLVLGESSSEQAIVCFSVLASSRNDTQSPVEVTKPQPTVITQILERVESRVPSYMVPSFLVTLNKLPVTVQGKLDQRYLRSVFGRLDGTTRLGFARSYEEADHDSATSPVERTIMECLASMLDVTPSNVNRHTSFLAVGLNSLNAIRLARSLEEQLHFRVNVAAVLNSSSPAQLAKALSEKQMQRDVDLTDRLLPGDLVAKTTSLLKLNGCNFNSILPCTPLQEVMLSATTSGGNATYCNTTRFTFSGDLQHLQSCWYHLIQRHDVLRTTFLATESKAHPFIQVVLNDPPKTWHETPVTKVNGHSMSTTNGHCDRNIEATAAEVPQVTLSSPVQVEVQDMEIYLRMHHALYDGIAMSTILFELKELYEGNSLPAPVPFEPFLREVASQNGAAATEFWSKQIEGFQPHPLPPSEEGSIAQESIIKQTLCVSADEVRAFAERYSCTSLAILQAGWAKALACAQDISDVCFGNVVSGRAVSVKDVDRLVAPCFNTIPVRVRTDSLRTNLDLVRVLHSYNSSSLYFQLTAARRIQALSQQPSARLFDTLLLFQPPEDRANPWHVQDDTVDMGIPVVVEVIPNDTNMQIRVQYMINKISRDAAQSLMDAFVDAVTSCLRYPLSSFTHFQASDAPRLQGSLRPQAIEHHAITDDKSKPVSSCEEWNSAEELVRNAFAELANIDSARISKHTSLYQIGLDSLNAVQIAAKLRKRGLIVDAADVMQQQCAAAIARLAQDRERASTRNEETKVIDLDTFDEKHRSGMVRLLPVNATSIEAIRPCTPSQSGMLAQFIQSEGALYVGHITYEVPRDCTFHDILQAWTKVQAKHQILRSGFQQTDDASNPFAMIVYRAGAFVKDLISEHEVLAEADSPGTIAKNLLQQLHVPTWRVQVFGAEGSRTMRISIHHSLYDAESLRILLNDFKLAIRPEPLEPAISFDTVLKRQLEGQAQSGPDSSDFWRNILGSWRSLKFPSLTPAVVSKRETKYVEDSSAVDVHSLESFCSRQGVTVQALGQTVWGILLAEYVGEPDVTFGTVFSGLSSSSSRQAFPSISTLPVYCDTSKANAVGLIHDMVSFNAAAQRHRFTPLSDIQRSAGATGQVLFDTVFVYQKLASMDQDFDWHIVDDSLDVDFAVSIELVAPSSGKMSLRLTYDTGVLPIEHAWLMLRQYDHIMLKILDPHHHQLPHDIISRVEPKETVLRSPVELLHQFIEEGARKHPDKIALDFIYGVKDDNHVSKTWTYRQLEDRSNQVANLIKQHKVEAGSTVAVCMAKSPEASFAFAGILKAGCAFLAMDPDLPVARRKFIMEDSECKLLFVNPGQSDTDLKEGFQTLELSEKSLLHLPISVAGRPSVDSSATCYCLYTSGTTGNPKGCELTHENAVQAMMSFQRLFCGRWDDQSRWLQFASYWFDVAVLEQFWTWSVGMTVVGAPRDLVLEDISGFIRSARITHIDLTPSLARLVKPEDVPSLHGHIFITGGEALKQEIINAWGPYQTICNGYGPTEATIGCTMNRFIDVDAKPSNIGRAFDNVGLYVFKTNSDDLVLRGAVGELCVSGKLVGKGYLNRPEQTAKSFPYLERYGEKVYRTGDLVRLLADESVQFIGRADTQTKLRGQRLEIDEIDSVIKASSESIPDVASLVTKSDKDREMLISFIVDHRYSGRDVVVLSSPETLELIQEAERACRDNLPAYMVPTHMIPVSRLPLTVNNKVDTKKLVALFASLSYQELQHLKGQASKKRAWSHREKQIAKTLCRLLSIDQDGLQPDSNIFSLGLSSITAINFATQLKRNGFKTATVAIIMKNQTLSRLAEALSSGAESTQDGQSAVKQARLSIAAFAHRHRTAVAQQVTLEISDIETLAPCTPLQAGLLTDSLKGSSRPYFNQFLYDISHLNVEKVQLAVEQLHERIAILRTICVHTDEGYAQLVLGSSVCSIRHSECNSEDLHWRLAELKANWSLLSDHDVMRPFEVHILRAGSQIILVFHAHHAIYDGISWDLTLEQLESLYTDTPVQDLGPSFFSALPYGPLCPRPREAAFWQSYLEGTRWHPLPISSGTSSDSDGNSELSLTFRLPLKGNVESIRKQLGISHQAIFQTAFAIALHQFAPQTDCYGVVLSGRSINLDDADKILGPLFNTVPFPIDLSASRTWAEQLSKAHQANADVLPYQHTPLRDIRRACGRFSSDPMFDVLFVFQQSAARAEQDAVFTPMTSKTPVEYPLAFEVTLENDNHIGLHVAGQQDYVSEHALRGLVDDFKRALFAMSQGLDQNISNEFRVEARSSQKVVVTSERQHEEQVDGVTNFAWTEDATDLRKMIAEIAGCNSEDVTEHTSIFTLGLDSIDAVKLASRLKKAGYGISVSAILKAQTIPRMLETLEKQSSGSKEPQKSSQIAVMEERLQTLRPTWQPNLRQSVDRILPATPSQEALLADMVRSDFKDYYNADVLLLRNDVDVKRLTRAWQEVVRASPILRTSFMEISDPVVDAVYAQLIHRPNDLNISEFRAKEMGEIDEYLDNVRSDVASTYSTEPPLRLAFFNIGSNQYLVISLAHAQYDGHSLALIHEDVSKAYWSSIAPRPMYESAIENALSATNEAARLFWRNELSGAKIKLLGGQSKDTSTKAHLVEHQSTMSWQSARDRCKQLSVSMQALAGAAWSLVLGHYLQELEVVMGVVFACRDSEEAEAIMFPTMNTVPVRATIHGSATEYVQHYQCIINGLRQYQSTPLRAIQSLCSRSVSNGVSDGSSVLFDTLFTYQQRPDTSSDEAGEPLYHSVWGASNVEYPIAAELEVVGSGIVLRAAVKDYLFDRTETQLLLKRFDHVLDFLVSSPNEPTLEFSSKHVSICKLPTFDLHDEDMSHPNSSPDLSDSEDLEDDLSAESAAIVRSTLSQVSKLPEEDISPNSTIESIGIDSISAIKVSALLRKASIKLSVGEILKARTLRRMVQTVESKTESPTPVDPPAQDVIAASLKELDVDGILASHGIDTSTTESIMPVLAGQQYMLAMWRASDGELFYPSFKYEMTTDRCITDMRRSWIQLVEEYPILRTLFVATSDGKHLLQVVLKSGSNSFYEGDGSEMSEGQMHQPMVQMHVCRRGNRYHVALKVHHALYDAISLPLLIERFKEILDSSPSTTAQIQFHDFVAVSISAESQTARKNFWSKYLRNLKSASLQRANPSTARKVEMFRPAAFISGLELQKVARKAQITVQAFLFAIYAKAYAMQTRTSDTTQDDVVFGIYLANRTHLPDLNNLAAPTLNLLPLLVRSPGQHSLTQIAKRIDTDLRQITRTVNSSASLAEIYEWTSVKLDSFVNFQKLPDEQVSVADSPETTARTIITPINEWTTDIARVNDVPLARETSSSTPSSSSHFPFPKELASYEPGEAYQHSLDLELSMSNDGRLSIGLFCREDMVNLEEAQRMVDGIVEELEAVVKEG